MSMVFRTTSNETLPSLSLSEINNETIRIYNSGTGTVNIKLVIAGHDGADPNTQTNENGKELGLEGWVSVRTVGGSWTQFTAPTYPTAFTSLTAYSNSITASSYLDIEIKLELPTTFDTSGLTHCSLVCLAVTA